ncbi:MAG: trypsin-like peptidase domain-containing protein [Myxococcota bacterium]
MRPLFSGVLGLVVWTTSNLVQAQALLPDRRTPIVEVVERAGPAVVNIATGRSAAATNPFGRQRSDAWERFFGRSPRPERQSLGSGVVIDASGLVVTNEHVVARASEITVSFSDRRAFEADVVGADREFDLAVLRIRDARDLPSVALGTATDLMPGETAVAIGNPFGLSNSVTAGVISALHRSIEAEGRSYEDFIQTDAAINPGNSGGALLNARGELIGINTAIYGEANGIGFAIPVDKVKAVVQEVLRYGEVRPVFTGLRVGPDSRPGARVVSVRFGSPGQRAGLQTGDRLLDASGQEVRSPQAWRRLEASWVAGQRVRIVFEREGQRRKVELSPTELKRADAVQMGIERLGFDVRDVNGGRRRVLQMVDVRPGGAAARAGIQDGDLLLGMYGRELRTRADFETGASVAFDDASVPLVVGRGRRAYYLNLELP